MSEIEDLIWAQASQHLFVTREQYMEQLRTFEIEPVERDGVLVVAWLRKGPELHMFTPKSGRPITRKMLAEAFEPQFEKYGHVDVRTPKLDRRQRRINERVGFVAVGEDKYNIHYRLDRGRWSLQRSTSCPSSP